MPVPVASEVSTYAIDASAQRLTRLAAFSSGRSSHIATADVVVVVESDEPASSLELLQAVVTSTTVAPSTIHL